MLRLPVFALLSVLAACQPTGSSDHMPATDAGESSDTTDTVDAGHDAAVDPPTSSPDAPVTPDGGEESASKLLDIELEGDDARWETTISGLEDGTIIRVGGRRIRYIPNDFVRLGDTASVQALDVQTLRWRELPPMPEPRVSHKAVATAGNGLFVVGGARCVTDDEPYCSEFYESGLYFDADRQAWSHVELPDDVPVDTRGNKTVVALDDGRVLLLYPNNVTEDTPFRVFDPADDTWSPAQQLHDQRVQIAGARLLSDGSVFVGTSEDGAFRISADLMTVERGPALHVDSNDAMVVLESGNRLLVARQCQDDRCGVHEIDPIAMEYVSRRSFDLDTGLRSSWKALVPLGADRYAAIPDSDTRLIHVYDHSAGEWTAVEDYHGIGVNQADAVGGGRAVITDGRWMSLVVFPVAD